MFPSAIMMTQSLFLVKSRQTWYIAKKAMIWGVRMESFISRQELAEQQHRFRFSAWVFRGLAMAMLAGFIVMCLVIRTANERTVTGAMILSMTLAGWACIAVYRLRVRPARAKAGHLEMLLTGETEEYEGILHLSGRTIQVPKSIRVRRVTLEGDPKPNPAEEPDRKSLNVDDSLAGRMPSEGSRVRVQAVNDYITGLEVLSAGGGSAGKAAGAGRARQALRQVSALVIPFILWTMAVVIVGGFIFTRIMDTDAGHKIVIYADCEVRNGPELADRLERQLGDPVRMVKVRPFTYDMFGSTEIQEGDLYIVSAGKAEDLRAWFVPLPEDMRAGENMLVLDGVPYGVPAYCRETWDEAAGAYFDYEPKETYYLVFSAASLHLEGNEGATDNRAAEAAKMLLEIQ